MAIETESRRVIVIEADDRDVKRAEAAMARRQAAAAKKQDEYLAGFVKAQGELTKETLTTARAAQALLDKEKETAKALDLIGLSIGKVEKKQGALNKSFEVAGQQIKAMGMSLLSGFGAGILGGILGGSISSIVQKAFAPPTDAELARMSRASAELQLFGRAVRDVAKAEMERRRTRELEKAGLSDAAKAIEAVTHKNALDQLIFAEKELGAALKNNEISALQYNAALRDLRQVEKEWAEQAERYTKQSYTANRLPTDPLTGRPLDSEEQARRERRERAKARWDAGAKARQERDELEKLIREGTQLSEYGQREARFREIYGAPDARGEALIAADRAQRQQALERSAQVLANRPQGPTWIERTVGKKSDFDLAVASFDAISSAATSAYDALVEGQLSASKAAATFIRSVVKGLGQQFLVEGLGESARAIARLAVGDFAGAAKHGQSAAAFFAGAAVAGVIAHAMGGGGGGGRASAGAGGGSGGGSGGSGEGTSTAVVVLSHSFLGADDETQRRAAERMVQAGTKRQRAVRFG